MELQKPAATSVNMSFATISSFSLPLNVTCRTDKRPELIRGDGTSLKHG
jgi:hypothetical protein